MIYNNYNNLFPAYRQENVQHGLQEKRIARNNITCDKIVVFTRSYF